jgi:hypothetical protein
MLSDANERGTHCEIKFSDWLSEYMPRTRFVVVLRVSVPRILGITLVFYPLLMSTVQWSFQFSSRFDFSGT